MAKLNWAVNPQQGREFRGDVLLDTEQELRLTWFWGSDWGRGGGESRREWGVGEGKGDREVGRDEEWA